MSPTLTLRQGGAADIDPMLAVMQRAFDPRFGEAWNRGQCLGILSLPDVWLVLAEEGANTVGFALSRLLVGEAELLLLAVVPEVRSQGIATALIDRTVAIAGSAHANRLLLEVRDGNDALHLYQRTGFAEIGRRRGYYRGPDGLTCDALTLARPMADALSPAYKSL